jgi:hypothetical protein
MNASPSAGVHCQWYNAVNSDTRRIRRRRATIVEVRMKRADCWRHHPSSIASNTAGAGSRCTTLSANTRCTEPGRCWVTSLLYLPQH